MKSKERTAYTQTAWTSENIYYFLYIYLGKKSAKRESAKDVVDRMLGGAKQNSAIQKKQKEMNQHT